MTFTDLPPNIPPEPLPMARQGPLADVAETQFLLTYLKDHDAFCPLCRYNLRNLSKPRCPECGRDIRLTVGLTEPYLRGLIFFLVPMCLSAGAGVISAIFLGFVTYHEGLDSFAREVLRRPLIGFIFLGPIASLLPALLSILLYRQFIRLDKAVQYLLAALAWFWDAVLAVAFLAALFRL